MSLTRRQLLQRCGYMPLAAMTLPLLAGCDQASTAACADPELLSRGEEHMRATLKYVEISTDESRLCQGCQFFSTVDAASCGHCEILNGPVHERGYCASWAAR